MKCCIAAIATAYAPAGIGVVRLSGEGSIKIAAKFFKSSKNLESLNGYEASYGKIYDEDFILDDGVALIFKAPKSYTGEDVVEISCHGGLLILDRLLKLCLKNGARLATNGEFTKRAFLNGKLNLTQAESVMELVSANSKSHLKAIAAIKQGALYKKVRNILDVLVEVSAKVAVYLDYPEEEFNGFEIKKLAKQIESEKQNLKNILKTQKFCNILKDGVNVILIGRPNVGKSTIMNFLCGEEKSIVTNVEGTTRDVVEGFVDIKGIKFNIFDVAGIRDSFDVVEKIGIEKAINKLKVCDIAIFITDNNTKEIDIKILNGFEASKTILVYNKCDLNYTKEKFLGYKFFKTIETSKKDIKTIENLKDLMFSLNFKDTDKFKDYFVMLNERQKNNIENAVSTLDKALSIVENSRGVDAFGVILEEAIEYLLEVTGEKVSDVVLDEIFSKFCVGK